MAGQLGEKEGLGHGHEPGDRERDWEMPVDLRGEWTASLGQGEQENRDAEEPGRAGNDGAEPREIDQTAARVFELRRGQTLAGHERAELITQRKHPRDPKTETEWIRNRIPDDDRLHEALRQVRRGQQRI